MNVKRIFPFFYLSLFLKWLKLASVFLFKILVLEVIFLDHSFVN